MDVGKIKKLLREGKWEEALDAAGGSYPILHSIEEQEKWARMFADVGTSDTAEGSVDPSERSAEA